MAWMSQEKKKEIAVEMKKALKGTGVKYTLGVKHHSTIVFNMKSAPIDFIANYNETLAVAVDDSAIFRTDLFETDYVSVNPYHFEKHFTGKALEVLKKIFKVLNTGNWDKSDIMTDYFDVGWYKKVNIGQWNKPFVVKG